MAPNKKKTYLAVVSVGVLGLAVDRLVLTDSATGPHFAEAGTVVVPVAPTASDVQAKSQIPAVPFPKNIPRFGEGFTLRDVFVKPETAGALELAAARTATEAERAGHPDELGSDEFSRTRVLSAVFSDEGMEIAVVDGKWIRKGQAVAGCQLQRIEAETAHFQCHDGRATLKMSDVFPVPRN